MAAGPRDRPAEQARQRRHPERRSQPEHRHVGQPRGRRRERCQDERRQGAAARESVDRADHQRTPRQRPRADVDVGCGAVVRVHHASVMMHVYRTGGSLTGGEVHRAKAEGRPASARRTTRRRPTRAPASPHAGSRAPSPPRSTRRCGPAPSTRRETPPPAAALAGDERRHRGQMIGLERVAHAEQRAEARAGEEFEHRHGCVTQPVLYVNLPRVAIGGRAGIGRAPHVAAAPDGGPLPWLSSAACRRWIPIHRESPAVHRNVRSPRPDRRNVI